MAEKGPVLPRLRLPTRYEKLEEYAREENVAIESIVRPVDDARARVDALLRRVRDQGVGQFEFLVGLSGSGKTTFLRTLPKFFTGSTVSDVPFGLPLRDIVTHLRERRTGIREPSIYTMHKRDNPTDTDEDVQAFFEKLRVLFREEIGSIALIWPITDTSFSLRASESAWNVGRDSLIDPETKGRFAFRGLDKSMYYDTANITTQSLNRGRGLEAFGVAREKSTELVQEASTISEFYGKVQALSSAIAGKYGEVLKERIIPRVWILVAGDDARELNRIA